MQSNKKLLPLLIAASKSSILLHSFFQFPLMILVVVGALCLIRAARLDSKEGGLDKPDKPKIAQE